MARVLLVGKGAPEHGGIPSFIDTLMDSRLRLEHRLDFLNVASAAPPQGGRATVTNLLRTVKDARAVWAAAGGYDVVHVQTALAPGVTAIRAGLMMAVARARGAHPVLHVHGGRVPLWARTAPTKAVLRLALAPAERVASVSEVVADTLRRASRRTRVDVLDNGVDVDTFTPSGAPSDFAGRVLYVGLLTPRKGVVDLLEASAMLREDGVSHQLCLVGGTPDEGHQAEESVRRHITGDVTVRGAVEHDLMPDVYRGSDIFCLPSWYEAAPLSVLEAMASGLPVVATDVGDVPRMVADGQTGFLVPPHQPRELARAIGRLAADPGLCRTMGAAGRRLAVERFGSDTLISHLSEIYAEFGEAHR